MDAKVQKATLENDELDILINNTLNEAELQERQNVKVGEQVEKKIWQERQQSNKLLESTLLFLLDFKTTMEKSLKETQSILKAVFDSKDAV